MSAAVYQALANDPFLNALGVDGDSIFPDYVAEVVPRAGMFIILRWGDQGYQSSAGNGPTVLTVWVHQPAELGNDYSKINEVHNLVKDVLEGLEQVVGSDGVRVTSAYFEGFGGNLYDGGFKTITKTAGYRVLLRVVA